MPEERRRTPRQQLGRVAAILFGQREEHSCLVKDFSDGGVRLQLNGFENPLPWLHRARALTPLRLAEIALARIGPSAPIVIKDFAELVEHFYFNPDTPPGKSFACGSGRAFLFPSSTHRGNFKQVRPLNFRFRHNLECY
jgi:hypothetical protein